MSVNPNEERIKKLSEIARATKGQPDRGYLKKEEIESLIIDLNGGIKEEEVWKKYFGIENGNSQQEIFSQKEDEDSPF